MCGRLFVRHVNTKAGTPKDDLRPPNSVPLLRPMPCLINSFNSLPHISLIILMWQGPQNGGVIKCTHFPATVVIFNAT